MRTICQRTNINLMISLIHLALSSLAQRILIYGDDFLVQENALILSRKLLRSLLNASTDDIIHHILI